MTPQTGSFLSGLRVVLRFPLVRMPLLGGLMFLAMGLSNGFQAKYAGAPLTAFAFVVGMIVLALTVYAGFVRFVEGRPVSELALSGLGKDFGTGLLLGFGLYAACILVLVLLGAYRIEGLNPWHYLLPVIPMAVSSAFLEELIHRGVLFRVIEEYLGSWVALVATAAFFGSRHLGNPDATLVGAIFIAVEAGVLLAAAFMLTRRLWLPIGIHMAWNYTQAAIFSGTVSGVEMPPGLVAATITGPDLLTGGKFGVEASVIAFALCSAAGLVILAHAVRRGRVVPPMWTRSA